MRAIFKIASPKLVVMTLTLTADVAEWELLRDDLTRRADAPGREFAKKLDDLIRQAGEALSAETWTTGYATGPVEGAGE